MDPLKNLSSDFKSFLKTAGKDKIIDIKEYETLKSKAKTDDDKTVVNLMTKDSLKLQFTVKDGANKLNYDLAIDFSQPDPATLKAKSNDNYDPVKTSYNTLGEGDQKLGTEVKDQKVLKNAPLGSLDVIAGQFGTPELIAGLMGSIPYDKIRGENFGGDGPLGAQTPEDTLKRYSGVCRDIHQLGAYLLTQNGYEAKQVGYVGAQTSHSITVYKAPDGKGYGIIEYGKVYSPENIKSMLGGRYATSPEEAVNALNFGTATAIYLWTPPEKGKVGYVEGIFYTQKHQNYHKTLQLEHKDQLIIDRNLGIELEKKLGEAWSVKAGVNFDSPGDPTAKYAAHAAVGYKVGSEDNNFSTSIGVQYRPYDGARQVGTINWTDNPTLLAGADIRWKLTPFKLNVAPQFNASTVFSGNISGAFAAINTEKKSDAGTNIVTENLAYDTSYISGLPDAKLNFDQKFYGEIVPKLHYSLGVFAHYDANLAVAAMGMGADNPMKFFNLGVNTKLRYDGDPLKLYIAGQHLFHQVNNLDNTALSAGGELKVKNAELFTSATLLNSVEGKRLQLNEGLRITPIPELSITGSSMQEIVIAREPGLNYLNPGGVNVMLGFEARM